MTLFGNDVFASARITKLGQGHPGLGWAWLYRHHLHKKGNLDTGSHTEESAMRGRRQRLERCVYNHRRPRTAGRQEMQGEDRADCPAESPRQDRPADTSVLDSWLPELRASASVVLPTQLWQLVRATSSPSSLRVTSLLPTQQHLDGPSTRVVFYTCSLLHACEKTSTSQRLSSLSKVWHRATNLDVPPHPPPEWKNTCTKPRTVRAVGLFGESAQGEFSNHP